MEFQEAYAQMHNPAQSDDIDDTYISPETSRELFPPITTGLEVSQHDVTCQRSDAHDTNMHNNMRLCTFRERESGHAQRNRSISQEVNTGKTSHLNSISTTPALFMKCDSNRTSKRSGQSIISTKCNFSSIKCLPQTPRQIRKVETHHTPSARYSTATSVANHYNLNNTGSSITSARSFKIVPTDAAAEAKPPLESPLGKVELEQKVSLSEELHYHHEHQHQWLGEQNQSRPSNVDGFRCNSIISDIRMRQSYSLPSTVMPFSSLKEQTWNNKRHTTNTSTPATLPTITYNNESNKFKIEGELWLINNNNDKNNIFNSGLLAYTPTPNRIKSMKLMSNRRQWVVCEDNRLLVYSSWSASHGKLIAEMSFHRVHVLFQFTHSERTEHCNNLKNSNFDSGNANNSESPFSNITNKNTHHNTQMSSRHPAYVMHNDSSSQLMAANSWTRTSERANSTNITKQSKLRKQIFSAKSTKTVQSEMKSSNNKKRDIKSSPPAKTTTKNTSQLEKYHKEEEKHQHLSSQQRENDQYEEELEEELEQPRLSECKQITLSENDLSNITKRTIEESPFLSKYYSTSTQKCCDNTVGCNKYTSNKLKKSVVCRRSKNNHSVISLPSYYYYFGVEGLTHEVTSSTNRRSLLIFCTDSWKAYTLWIRFWNEMTMRYPVITHLLTTSIHRSMSSPEPILQDTSSPALWEDDNAIRHFHGDNELNENVTCNNNYINNGESSNNGKADCLYKNESNAELTNSKNKTNMHNLVTEQLLHKEGKKVEDLISHQEQQEELYSIKLMSCNNKIVLSTHRVQNEEQVERLHVEVHEMCAWVVLLTLCHDSKQECKKHVMSTFMEEELIRKLTILFEKSHLKWTTLNEQLENLTSINDTVSRLTNEVMETLSFQLEESRKSVSKQLAMINDYVKATCVSFTSWNDKLTHLNSNVNAQDITWSVILDKNIGKTHFATSSDNYCNLCKLFEELEIRLNTNDTCISEIIEHTLPLSLLEIEGTNVLKTVIACNGKLRKVEIKHILNAFASAFDDCVPSAYTLKSHEIQIIYLQQEETALRCELHAKEQKECLNYVLHLQRESAELAVHLFSSVTTLLNEAEEEHQQQHKLTESEWYLHTSCKESALENNDHECHLNEICVQTERCVFTEAQVQTTSIDTVTYKQKEEVESKRIEEEEEWEEEKEREIEESRLKEEQQQRVANLERENMELKTELAKLQIALLAHEQKEKSSESRNNSNCNVFSGKDSNFEWKRKIAQLENAITACQSGINLHEQTTNENIDTHEQEEDNYSAHELSVLDRSAQIINALQDKCTQLTSKHINQEEHQHKERKEEREHELRELYATESMQTCAELMLDAKQHFMASIFDTYRQLVELLYHTEVEEVIHTKNESNETTQRREELLDTLQENNDTLQQQIQNVQCDKLMVEHRNNTLECVIEECKESEKLLQEHVKFLQEECNTLSTDLFRCNKLYRDVLYRTESALVEARKENEANKSAYQSKLNEYNEFVKTVHNLTSQLVNSLGIVLNSHKRENALSAAWTVNEIRDDDAHLQLNDKIDSSAVSTDTSVELAQCTENLTRVLARVMERSRVDAEMHTELEKLYQFVTSETGEEQLVKCEGAELLELEIKRGNINCNNEISGHKNGSIEAVKLKICTIYDTLKEEAEYKHVLERTLKESQTRLEKIINKICTSDTVETKKNEIEDAECASTPNTLPQEINTHSSITSTLDKTLNLLEQECDKLYAKAGKKDKIEHVPVSSTQLHTLQLHDAQPSKVSKPFSFAGKTSKLNAPEFDDECQLIAEICYMRRLVRKKVADDELTTVHINHLINMLNLCQSRDRQRSEYR